MLLVTISSASLSCISLFAYFFLSAPWFDQIEGLSSFLGNNLADLDSLNPGPNTSIMLNPHRNRNQVFDDQKLRKI